MTFVVSSGPAIRSYGGWPVTDTRPVSQRSHATIPLLSGLFWAVRLSVKILLFFERFKQKILLINITMNTQTKTKVIATVGPASRNEKTLMAMVEAGVDVFRLNFSHSTHEEHGESIKMIEKINKKLGKNVAVLADLQGPKIRLGELKDGPFELKKGDEVIFTTQKVKGTAKKLYLSYESFAEDARVGDRMLIDDGKIEMQVVKLLNSKEVVAKTIYGGMINPRKGVNLPNTNISLPSLTEKDIKDLEFILTQPNISWIALSFVRQYNDVIKLRGMLEFKSHDARIIAKIEKPEAIKDIDNIVKVADAIMVARGDLGVEVPVENVPSLQKMIVRKCLAISKPVIIATQLMESMIHNPSPTRAEVTDVSNAILEGADAVMLSGETAVGKYPAKVIETMQRIIMRSEEMSDIYNRVRTLDPDSPKFLSDAICHNAIDVSEEVAAKAIIGMTKSGYTAFSLASFRPKANIYVFTESKYLLNAVSLIWGVRAFFYNKMVSNDNTIAEVHDFLKEKGLLEKGDIVINTGSMPIHEKGSTNFLKVSVIA